MTAHPESLQSLDRLYDLLADNATVGLTDDEQDELFSLLPRWPHVDPTELERTAAAIQLAGEPDLEPLPAHLMDRLSAAADAHIARPSPRVARPRRSSAYYWAVCGWTCAATAMIGFLFLQFSRRPSGELSLLERRDRLKQTDPSAKVFASDPKARDVTGTVVFSQSKQEGYMELKGLTPNDPAKSQYQLWIVDKGAPFKEPVDGGVFNVDADGTALVPVRAPLKLRDVSLFAVTKEPPGGVVVSEDGKLGKFVLVMSP